MRILVIKFRNIGDVLLTAPLVSTLRHAAPDNRVTALVKAGTEAMLEGHPDLEEVLVYPSRGKGESRFAFFRRQLRFFRELRARRFDLAITTTEGDRGVIAAWLSGARCRRGPFRPGKDKLFRRLLLTRAVRPRPGRLHTVMRNLELLPEEMGPPRTEVQLTVSEADRQLVRTLLSEAGWQPDRPLVHVHPTSRWFFKCWTDTAMAAVIDHLIEHLGVQVALTCGPDKRERAKLDEIMRLCRQHPIDLGGRLTLKQTAAVSGLARLFFGVDTAPMHMAAAMGTPVVALFGPSGAFDWGPWPNGWQGDDTPYPSRCGSQSAGPHHVIQQPWSCVPCGEDGCGGSKRSDCLEHLYPEEVLPVLEAALGK
ncbi:MAG: putative lipopolysaccharide heptosyltransferase III [Gammaproteobacteria bacterium]